MTCMRGAILAVSVLSVSSCSKLQGMGGETAQSGSPSTPHVGGGGSSPARNTDRRPPLIPYKCDDTERSLSMCGNEPTRASHFTAATWFRARPDFTVPKSHKPR